MLAEEQSPSDLLGCYTNERASFFKLAEVLLSIREGKKEPASELIIIPCLYLSCRIPPFYKNTNCLHLYSLRGLYSEFQRLVFDVLIVIIRPEERSLLNLTNLVDQQRALFYFRSITTKNIKMHKSNSLRSLNTSKSLSFIGTASFLRKLTIGSIDSQPVQEVSVPSFNDFALSKMFNQSTTKTTSDVFCLL